MILITLRLPVHPERVEEWLRIADQYARDVNDEPGCVFFEWSRSLSDPTTFIANEGFLDQTAAEAHMKTPHVPALMEAARDFVREVPSIIYVDAPESNGYVAMAEIEPRQAS
jgi:quinol monooxygenase YgiN